jgi:6-pyruvoyltetrahydropterin/6-carboxytetrahydropterin synthase
MLVDYGDMKECVADLVEKYLDHHHLNETLAPFGVFNPTSEVIAQWMFNQLRPFMPTLVEVQIEETCTSKAVYRPQQANSSAPSAPVPSPS